MKTRSLIAAVSIGVLLDASGPAVAQSPQRELVVGLTSKQFQAEFDRRNKANFAPIAFSAHYNARGKITASAIFEKRTQGRFNFKFGQSQKETSELVKKMSTDGFRLQHLSATNFGPERYTSIWQLAPGQEIAIRYGYPLTELLKRHKTFTAKGYVIHALTAFRDKGRTYYTAAWEKDDLFKRVFQARLSVGAFVKQNRAKAKEKYRVKQLYTYLDGRRQYVACIWENKPGPDQVVETNLTPAQLKKTGEKMKGTGHVPRLITGLALGRLDRYLVVWEKTGTSKK